MASSATATTDVPASERAPITNVAAADRSPTREAELRKKTQRVPLALVCPCGVAHEAQAMRDGFIKYGYASFLDPTVKMSMLDCISAAERHLLKLKGGIDYDPSGAHHAGHARAMLGILLECLESGQLIDDRHTTHTKSPYVERMFDRMQRDNTAHDGAVKVTVR
jgi:Domain of unknown function (DUF5664)